MILKTVLFSREQITLCLSTLPDSLNHIFLMKVVLIAIIGVLLWQSTEARQFTSDALQTISEIIEPDVTKNQSIGERIDSFLD